MVGIASAPLLAVQGPAEEELTPRPSYKDVYCAGFVSSSKIVSPLTIIAGEDAVGRLTYQQDDFVYLSQGSRDGVQVGQEYLVVRPMKDPSRIQAFGGQKRILRRIGTVYADVGRVRVHVAHETTATARIVHVCDAVQNGDLLVPYQERPTADFRENGGFDRFAPFAGGEEGMVVAARDFPALIGRGDAIYVNLGTNQGVKVGDYYRVFRYATGTLYEGANPLPILKFLFFKMSKRASILPFFVNIYPDIIKPVFDLLFKIIPQGKHDVLYFSLCLFIHESSLENHGLTLIKMDFHFLLDIRKSFFQVVFTVYDRLLSR